MICKLIRPLLTACLSVWVGMASEFSWDRALAQTAAPGAGSPVIVEGEFRAIFRSDSELLIQVAVRGAKLPSDTPLGHLGYPAPGENIYVHVSTSQSSQLSALQSGAPVRLLVTWGEAHQWEGRGNRWLELGSSDPTLGASDASSRRSGAGADSAVLGLATKSIEVGRQKGLQVVLVIPDTPAARSGLEPGDILVAVNGRPLTSKEQVEQVFQATRGSFALTVRNVRDGRDVEIQVDGAGNPPAQAPSSPAADSPRSVGMETELAFFGAKAALKVVQVSPTSAAARAGIRPGMLILDVDGSELKKPEDLESLVRTSRGALQLTIVSPPDRQPQTLRVSF